MDHLGAVLVPDDEVVVHALPSEDGVAVGDASSRSDLRFVRIVQSVGVLTSGVSGALHVVVLNLANVAPADSGVRGAYEAGFRRHG